MTPVLQIIETLERKMSKDRVQFDDDGFLDEVVTGNATVHIERTGESDWWISIETPEFARIIQLRSSRPIEPQYTEETLAMKKPIPITGVKLTPEGKLVQKPGRMSVSAKIRQRKSKKPRAVSKAKAATVKAQRP